MEFSLQTSLCGLWARQCEYGLTEYELPANPGACWKPRWGNWWLQEWLVSSIGTVRVYSSLLRKSGLWTSNSVCAWLETWKGNVPALGAYRHQAFGTSLIAAFFTQTYNSSWHIDICRILLKLNWNPDILFYILYCSSADSRGSDAFNNSSHPYLIFTCLWGAL